MKKFRCSEAFPKYKDEPAELENFYFLILSWQKITFLMFIPVM